MAAGSTYTPIATNTLSSATATVTFSAISATYTDLVCVINGGATSSGLSGYMYINSDSGTTKYSYTYLSGNGTAASSGRAANQAGTANYIVGTNVGIPASLTNSAIINIMNYANTTTYKTIVCRSGAASTETLAAVSVWRDTVAITSITFGIQSATTWLSGTTFTLYGITAA